MNQTIIYSKSEMAEVALLVESGVVYKVLNGDVAYRFDNGSDITLPRLTGDFVVVELRDEALNQVVIPNGRQIMDQLKEIAEQQAAQRKLGLNG